MPPAHFSDAHSVPEGYLWQPPAPSHVPSVPQDEACWSMQTPRGSPAPSGTGAQVPSDVDSAQLRQLPVQAVAQQTPSAQKLLPHSLFAEQGCPSALGPQLPATQLWPATQSASLAQWLTQALLVQRYGSQFSIPCGRQVPRPSQVPAVFMRSPLHDGDTQTVSAAYLAQPPRPSQAPVWPQLDLSVAVQTLWGSTTPIAVGQQVPTRPLWLQLTQGPVQATLQQKPSAQNPDAHWVAAVQTAPAGRLPQLPLTHLTFGAQSASDEQVTTQAFVLVLQVNGEQMVACPGVQMPNPSQTRMPPTEAPSQVPGWQTVPET